MIRDMCIPLCTVVAVNPWRMVKIVARPTVHATLPRPTEKLETGKKKKKKKPPFYTHTFRRACPWKSLFNNKLLSKLSEGPIDLPVNSTPTLIYSSHIFI